jgi:hypothetical protein
VRTLRGSSPVEPRLSPPPVSTREGRAGLPGGWRLSFIQAKGSNYPGAATPATRRHSTPGWSRAPFMPGTAQDGQTDGEEPAGGDGHARF